MKLFPTTILQASVPATEVNFRVLLVDKGAPDVHHVPPAICIRTTPLVPQATTQAPLLEDEVNLASLVCIIHTLIMFVALQNQDALKRPWSTAEDSIVIELVHRYGPKNWTQIAAQVPGRTGKQCRQR